MSAYSDSTDRALGELLGFGLGFLGFIIAVAGIIIASLGLALTGAVILLLVLLSFLSGPDD